MVTFVKSTYHGSNVQYAVSGVRVLDGPDKDGLNEIRLQLAGTNVELDINVDFSTAESIQGAIDQANGVDEGAHDTPLDITQLSTKALIDELYNRFNEE